jgi:RES domain-containing protein
MVLWRISRHRDLSGTGGLKAHGRWHYAGYPIVYLAGNPATALLEVCVHTSGSDVPPEFTLLKIEGPDADISVIEPEDLPPDWRTSFDVTQALGTAWLRKGEGVLLRVPSAIVPETSNFLLNPMHSSAADFRISDVFACPGRATLDAG